MQQDDGGGVVPGAFIAQVEGHAVYFDELRRRRCPAPLQRADGLVGCPEGDGRNCHRHEQECQHRAYPLLPAFHARSC